MSGRKWSDLSAGTRILLTVGAAVEGCLKAAALTDIARRPRTRIRGSKWLWAAIVTVVNSFGGAPLAYFAFGRR
ncbi:MAG: PLDc_N domain-containing protein [Candidatus Dormibacteraeota bacterium]|nr:PLDc_N domain-containing protein [Candidatus Dormibacteraeota bacterium]MBO0760797.1 PLDc_N domain-containing protein [Candidatus Dormibacteraeota bacterium]